MSEMNILDKLTFTMKNLLITLGFIILFAASSSAQELITTEFARKYVGKRVMIWDTVTSVKVINPQYAELMIDKHNPHDQLVIILKCPDAGRMAVFLKGKVATAKGVVSLANLGALLQVNNIRDIDEVSHIQIDPVDTKKAPKKKQKV
jgi:hypothetical protein